MFKMFISSLVFAAILTAIVTNQSRAAGDEKIQLKITGGDETNPRDHGRPVALVAGGLGVSPDVFRTAFSQVKPARAGTEPDPAQVRRNKSVLMAALAPHGVTNDDLDRVSNFYRYVPGGNRKWPMKPAAGYAVIKEGAVASVVITDPGYGYNSQPTVTVPGHPGLALTAHMAFSSDLKKNGSLSSITPQGGKDPQVELGRVLPSGTEAVLNLTAAQKREIAELEKEVGARLSKILTAEQKKQLAAGK